MLCPVGIFGDMICLLELERILPRGICIICCTKHIQFGIVIEEFLMKQVEIQLLSVTRIKIPKKQPRIY